MGKFICIGLNYRDHAAESGMPLPAEPVLFMKATSAIMGPNDDAVIPRGSEKTDWEVELGVVIGKAAKYVREDEALGHVAGYCVVNDLSERAFQLEGTGQWTKGKSADAMRAKPAFRVASFPEIHAAQMTNNVVNRSCCIRLGAGGR